MPTKKQRDIVQWLRQESASCFDLARISEKRGKKGDAKAFEKKSVNYGWAADELERLAEQSR